MPVINLRTLDLRGKVSGPALVDGAVRALKKRVFTEDEWNFLNTRSTADLQHRIRQGDIIIRMLYRPEMMNMSQARADEISSNLRFQQDEIREIIKKRGGQL